jgi:malate synthase
VAFINTGLPRPHRRRDPHLDGGRAFSRKDFIKRKSWITAYENQNVDIGLECGLRGQGADRQGHVGHARPMAAMLEQKIEHPRAGANCAWVPSPTAATLHALHYHKVDVRRCRTSSKAGGRAPMSTRCSTSRWPATALDAKQIRREVENNAQGILGYVVRWIDQGVGCSKVPDINDVGLMEDRATCRISAQHIANWLHHGVVSEAEVMAAMRKMAEVVDARTPAIRPTSRWRRASTGSPSAACDLVFKGSPAAALGLHRAGAARARPVALPGASSTSPTPIWVRPMASPSRVFQQPSVRWICSPG